MGKDQYFVKLYNVKPEDIDENGHVNKATPLMPFYGAASKQNMDYIDKPIEYERDRLAPHEGMESIEVPEGDSYKVVDVRAPTSRGASALSYQAPGGDVIYSSGSMSGTKESPTHILLEKNNPLFNDAEERFFDSLMNYMGMNPDAPLNDAQRRMRPVFGKIPIPMLVSAPEGSLITNEDVRDRGYEGWRDNGLEFQLRRYTPVSQLRVDDDMFDTVDPDLNKLKSELALYPKGLFSAWGLSKVLGNANASQVSRAINNIETKIGSMELMRRLRQPGAIDELVDKLKLDLTPVKMINREKFMKQYPLIDGVTPSDECLKNIYKDMTKEYNGRKRQSNINKGCMCEEI